MAYTSGKLTKNLVRTLGPGRHCDGHVPYLVVDPSCAQRWIVRAKVKGQRNRQGNPLRTDFGLGGVDVVTLNVARERALFRRGRSASPYRTLADYAFPKIVRMPVSDIDQPEIFHLSQRFLPLR